MSQDTAAQCYAQGNQLLEEGKPLEAIDQYRRATEIDPASALSYNGWGNALHRLQRHEEASERYLQAAERDGSEVAFANLQACLEQLPPEARQSKISALVLALTGNNSASAAQGFYSWGSVLGMRGAFAEAFDKFQRAITIAPNSSWTYHDWAVLLCQQGRYEDALTKYRKAIELGHQWINFSYLQECLDHLAPEAQERNSRLLEQALMGNPPEVGKEMCCDWGDSLASQGRQDEAIVRYRQAIGIDPQYARPYHIYGNALHALHRHAEAIEQYQAAAALDATIITFSTLVECLDQLPAESRPVKRQLLEEAITKNSPAHASQALFNWGNALTSLKRLDEACELYRKATDIQPDYVSAYNDWGNALANLKRFAEAIEIYRKATDVQPDYMYAYFNWGLALANQKHFAEAIKLYRKATDIQPDYAPAYFNWGVALENLKRLDEAIEVYRKATDIQPGYVDAYNNWGNALADSKRFEEAIELYRKATDIQPDYIYAYFNWGNALANLKRFEEAIATYQLVSRHDPRYPYAYHNIANIYETYGDYCEARAWWSKARAAYEQIKNTREQWQFFQGGDDFMHLGTVLGEVYAEFDTAEKIFRQGLDIENDHAGLLINLGNLYQKVRESCSGGNPSGEPDQSLTNRLCLSLSDTVDHAGPKKPDGPLGFCRQPADSAFKAAIIAHGKARDFWGQAERRLRQQLTDSPAPDTAIQLARLLLGMEDFAAAEKLFLQARELGAEALDLHMGLGSVYLKQERFAKAINEFSAATTVDQANLAARNNLAESYVKAGMLEKAETEYMGILDLTQFHVEANVGLGHVYSAMADAGDSDLYDHAIHHFKRALELGRGDSGSKRLTGRDKAAVLYALGYAQVKLYESSRAMREETHLQAARRNFEECKRLDRTHHKAQRVLDKLDKRYATLTPQRLMETWGPAMVIGCSLCVFVLSQFGYFVPEIALFGKQLYLTKIELSAYVPLSLGALLFMIAGLSLPQLMKLKVAGIEMEKSTIDQMMTSASLGIKK